MSAMAHSCHPSDRHYNGGDREPVHEGIFRTVYRGLSIRIKSPRHRPQGFAAPGKRVLE